jgi:hypothetical protein
MLWRLVLFCILFSLMTATPLLLGGFALWVASLAIPGLIDPQANDMIMRTIGLPIIALATLASLWLAGCLLDRRPLADYGLHIERGWWLDLGFGLALGALLMGGIFVVQWAAGWITITDILHTATPGQSFWLAIIPPLVLFLSVGFYEEALVRGYLLRNLAEGLNFAAIGGRGALLLAWVLSSALFGLLHAGNPNATAISTSYLIMAGVFLGLGYLLTGQLAMPIGIHITWNFFQGNVFGFPVSGGDFRNATFLAIEQGGPELWTGGAFGPEAGLLGLAAMLVGCLLTLLWVRWRQGSIGLQLALAEPPARTAAQPANSDQSDDDDDAEHETSVPSAQRDLVDAM